MRLIGCERRRQRYLHSAAEGTRLPYLFVPSRRAPLTYQRGSVPPLRVWVRKVGARYPVSRDCACLVTLAGPTLSALALVPSPTSSFLAHSVVAAFFRFLRTPALPQNVLRKRLFAFALDAHCVLCGIRRWYATNAAGRYDSEDQQWRASFVGGKFHSLILLHLWGLPDAQFVEPMDHKSKTEFRRQLQAEVSLSLGVPAAGSAGHRCAQPDTSHSGGGIASFSSRCMAHPCSDPRGLPLGNCQQRRGQWRRWWRWWRRRQQRQRR